MGAIKNSYMRLILSSFLIILLFSIISCGTPNNTTPELPKTETKPKEEALKYDWVKCEECFVEIQKPQGWFFSKSINPNGFEYYFTPENFNDTRVFKRGFSLTVLTEVKKSINIAPSQQIEKFINNAKTIDPQLNVKKIDMQELQGFSFLLKDPSQSPDSLVSSIFLIANDKTDVMYTFVFQYEKKDWDKMFVIGGHMLKNIKVSKEY